MASPVVPYKNQSNSKKEQVAQMFDNISGKYDLLNHLLSGGIDVLWRKKAIRLLKSEKPRRILDIATGTADFALEAMTLNPEKIIGVDISEGMLAHGRDKIRRRHLSDKIELLTGDSENLAFADNSFDAVIVSFGVRNFENLEKGLSDMLRVLRPGGMCVILEFSKPKKFPYKSLYNFYSSRILPAIGNTISRDQAAYTYLPESVAAFPEGNDFLSILSKTGYTQTQWISLTFGICSIYTGKKVQ
jgi:demethylmenaquinone methyltransferase / 2-methoxy-6-polyprenyl-1,4-benzoquinol methylase